MRRFGADRGRAPRRDTMPALRCIALTLSSCLLACGAEDEGQRAGAVPASGDVWVVQRPPEVDIGGRLGPTDTVLMVAAGATRLSSGVIAVADPYAPAIRFFSPEGELLRSVGKRGQGPGEFLGPRWLRQCGPDSIFVWDSGQGRVTVLDSAGSVVRQFRLDVLVGAMECSRQGVLVAIGEPESVSVYERVSGPLTMLDREGKLRMSLGEVPHYESRPLGRFTSLAVSDSLLFVGTADSAFAEIRGFQGSRLGGVAIGEPSRKPTARQYDLALEAGAAQFGERDREAAKAMQLRFFPEPPEVLPPYSGFFLDPDGILWALTSFVGDTVTVLQAITQDGAKLGTVEIPGKLKVFEVGRGYVLAGTETEEGVPRVVMYRIGPQG